MEPQIPQFGPFTEGVRKIPKGSKPLTTPNPPSNPPQRYGVGDILKQPLPVNAVTNPYGNTPSQKYGQGEKMADGYTRGIPVEVNRPKPNQGVTVPGKGGKPPVTIGGEKGIKVQPAPKRKWWQGRGGGGMRGGIPGGLGGVGGGALGQQIN